VIEVGLLQHLAEVAGAELNGQGLLFVVFEVVVFGLAVMMWSVELFLLNHLFFKVAGAGRVGRNGRHRGSAGSDWLWLDRCR